MKRLPRGLAVAMLLLAATGTCRPTLAADGCQLPPMRAGERPDPEGRPTSVKVGVLVADITQVNDVEQEMEGDFFVKMQWRDPRLIGLSGCQFPRTSVWFPSIQVLNSSQLDRKRTFSADKVDVVEDGNVVYFQRYFGTVATYHYLERFPFDRHRIQLRAADFDYSIEQLKLEVDTEFTGIADLLNIPDWAVSSVSAESEEYYLREFNKTLSLFVLSLEMSRLTRYYVVKVIIPTMLITMMSWVVFWISPEKFGPQIGLSATSMLTLIAFQFSLTSQLPKVSYLTLMDRLLLISTLMVFLSLIIAALTSYLVTTNRSEFAHRIDRVCRWSFPLAFLMLWLNILLAPTIFPAR